MSKQPNAVIGHFFNTLFPLHRLIHPMDVETNIRIVFLGSSYPTELCAWNSVDCIVCNMEINVTQTDMCHHCKVSSVQSNAPDRSTNQYQKYISAWCLSLAWLCIQNSTDYINLVFTSMLREPTDSWQLCCSILHHIKYWLQESSLLSPITTSSDTMYALQARAMVQCFDHGMIG